MTEEIAIDRLTEVLDKVVDEVCSGVRGPYCLGLEKLSRQLKQASQSGDKEALRQHLGGLYQNATSHRGLQDVMVKIDSKEWYRLLDELSEEAKRIMKGLG